MCLIKKLEWHFKNRLIKDIIKYDGEIFGGAVRDKYLHDTHSGEFYKIISDLQNYEDLSSVPIDKDKLYDDKTFHPELFGRWIIPNDIDAYCNISNLPKLLEKISERNRVDKLFERDPSKYIDKIPSYVGEKIVHHRYFIHVNSTIEIYKLLSIIKSPLDTLETLSSKLDELKFASRVSFTIKLDLMVSNITESENILLKYDHLYEPPFGNLDFECNGLFLNKDRIRICKFLLYKNNISENDLCRVTELTMKILSDIKNKKAIYTSNNHMIHAKYRCNLMISKGWTIEGLFKSIEIVVENENDNNQEKYTGHCIICHGDLGNIMLKMKCCDARYHAACMHETFNKGESSIINTEKCIMCKKKIVNTRNDAKMLCSYLITAPLLDWWPSLHYTVNTDIPIDVFLRTDNINEINISDVKKQLLILMNHNEENLDQDSDDGENDYT